MDMLPYYRNKFMLVDYYRKKGKLIHLDLPQEEIDRKMLRCGHAFLHYICDGTIAKL
jgi:hypothetical protein